MKQAKFPEGWDESRAKKVIAHYDSQTDDEAVAEDDAVKPSETDIRVPTDLVPAIRELIAKRQSR